MKLSRYWMTGCMALVLLVAGRGASAADREESDPDERHALITASTQQPLDQTLRRLQTAARRHGLDVMVNLPSAGAAGQVERVLVLAHRDDGRTPVVQAAAPEGHEGRWALPMRLVISTSADGGTHITYGDPEALGASGELPPEMLRDVAVLPSIVSAALQAGPPIRSGVDRLT
jgi:uncharacterized protein (DUF302 family)